MTNQVFKSLSPVHRYSISFHPSLYITALKLQAADLVVRDLIPAGKSIDVTPLHPQKSTNLIDCQQWFIHRSRFI
jgi:hypothetical protein